MSFSSPYFCSLGVKLVRDIQFITVIKFIVLCKGNWPYYKLADFT